MSVLNAVPVSATTVEWTGSSSTGWATGANWIGGAAPADDITTDIAYFNSAVFPFQPTVSGTRSVNGLLIGDGSTATDAVTISGASTPIFNLGSGGITLAANAGAVTLASGLPVRVAASQNWTNNSGSLLTVAGIVSNAADVAPYTLTIAGSGSGGTTISGVISDGGTTGVMSVNINTTGSGIVTLSGANTFTGGLTLTQGILRTGSGSATNLALGSGTLTLAGGELQLYRPAQAAGANFGRNTAVTGNVQITSGENSDSAGVTHTLGTLSIGDQTLTIASSGEAISGTSGVTFGATSVTGNSVFHVANGSLSTTQLTLGALNDGGVAHTITKTGDGTLSLSTAATSYTGNLVVKSGILSISGATSLGTGTLYLGDTSGNSSVQLRQSGGNTTVANNIVVQAGNTGSVSITNTASGGNTSLTYSGDISLGHDLALSAGTSSGLTLGGDIRGPVAATITSTAGNITLSGSIGSNVTEIIQNGGSTLTISGSNPNFRGVIRANSGTVTASSQNSTNDSTVVYVNSGATFNKGSAGSSSGGRTTIAGINDGPDGGGIVTRGGGGGTRPMELAGDGDYTFSGSLQNSADAFSLIKTGSGTQTLTGASTYTGGTSLGNGTLKIAVNSETGNIGSLAATTIGGHGGTLIYDGTGSTASNNNSQSLGSLTFSRGSTTIASIKGSAASSTLTFASLAARTSGATGNFVVADGTNGTDNKIMLTGVAADSFIDRAYFFNGGNYAYNDSGGFVRGINWGVDSGSSTAAGGTSLASATYAQTTGDVTAQAAATFTGLNIVNTSNTARAFTLGSGVIVTTNGILISGNGGGTTTISGGSSIRAASNAELVIRTDKSGDILEISGTVGASGSNALTKDGDGTLILSGTNTYTGGTRINGGVVSISSNANLGSQTSGLTLTMNNGTLRATSTFGLYNGTEGTNNRNVNITGTGTFDVTASNTLTIAGVISNDWVSNTTTNSNSSFHKGSLVKTGTGTLLLSGTNTYNGSTIVSAGTLALASTGSIANSSLIRVANGATFNASALSGGLTLASGKRLENRGTFVGDLTVASGATFSAGNSPGHAIQDGNLTLNTGSTFEWELVGNTTSGAGTNYDWTSFTSGGLTIQSGVTADLVFDYTGSSVDWANAFWDSGHSWLVYSGASSLGNVAGVFESILIGHDSLGQDFSLAGGSFSFTTSGNDIYLNYTAVPEPSTYAMLLGGLGLLAYLRRRFRPA